jgi:hypothetical protein
MIRRLFFAAFSVLALASVSTPADARTAVGTLECRSPGGFTFLFSYRDYICLFRADWGPAFQYRARLTSLGLQAGVTRDEVLLWRVFAPTARFDSNVLRGNYAGASAGAAIIVGLGANVLVGGSNQTISLQPISVEAKVGINFAIAGTTFSLY